MESLLMIWLAIVGTPTAIVGTATANSNLLDLSYTYNLDPQASHHIRIVEKGMNRVYISVELNQICSSVHTGTHLEAPITFKNYTWSVDNIPFERLWRVPGVVVDVSYYANSEYQITADVLQRWLDDKDMTLPDGGILLIYTGYETTERMADVEDDEETSISQPALTKDAAEWLANYGRLRGQDHGVIGVGIDLNSLDGKDSNASTSARARLYEDNIYALHNLKNLHMLPRDGFLVTVMPMKIHNGVGAPARVLAEKVDTRPKVVEEEDHYGHWDSERDSRYPHPEWGDHGDRTWMVMSASQECSIISPMVIALPILMVLRG